MGLFDVEENNEIELGQLRRLVLSLEQRIDTLERGIARHEHRVTDLVAASDDPRQESLMGLQRQAADRELHKILET